MLPSPYNPHYYGHYDLSSLFLYHPSFIDLIKNINMDWFITNTSSSWLLLHCHHYNCAFMYCFTFFFFFPNPSARAGYDTRSIFEAEFNRFEFRVFLLLDSAEEPSLPYYLPLAGGRIFGFIPFPRVLVLCEMQSVRSRIRTCVAVSTSCDDNHYTTGTSLCTVLSSASK